MIACNCPGGLAGASMARAQGLGEIEDAIAGSVASNVASAAVVGILQAFNVVIPGLGVVLGFLFKKLFGAMFADDPPDPYGQQAYAIAQQLVACAQSKDYATGAQLAFDVKAFSFLHFATQGKSDNAFFVNLLGDAMQRRDFTRLLQFADMLDCAADLQTNCIEQTRVSLLANGNAIALAQRIVAGDTSNLSIGHFGTVGMGFASVRGVGIHYDEDLGDANAAVLHLTDDGELAVASVGIGGSNDG
jgi:hypothetical protein